MMAATLLERQAKQAFLAQGPRHERVQRLKALSRTIERFARIVSKSPIPSREAPVRRWDEAARDRTVKHLERLANDVRYLAFASERGA